jgi:hypothetical protein
LEKRRIKSKEAENTMEIKNIKRRKKDITEVRRGDKTEQKEKGKRIEQNRKQRERTQRREGGKKQEQNKKIRR